MGARNVAVATKVSDDELSALLIALDRKGGTKSGYIADALAERLRREGYLEKASVGSPGEADLCLHKNVSRFSWGNKCQDCNTVLTGPHAAG